jgi:hypothetical protein
MLKRAGFSVASRHVHGGTMDVTFAKASVANPTQLS